MGVGVIDIQPNLYFFCISENWYSIVLNGQVNGDMMIAPLVN